MCVLFVSWDAQSLRSPMRDSRSMIFLSYIQNVEPIVAKYRIDCSFHWFVTNRESMKKMWRTVCLTYFTGQICVLFEHVSLINQMYANQSFSRQNVFLIANIGLISTKYLTYWPKMCLIGQVWFLSVVYWPYKELVRQVCLLLARYQPHNVLPAWFISNRSYMSYSIQIFWRQELWLLTDRTHIWPISVW